MIFYISDLHFGHKNAIIFDKRPFATVEEMDNALIERWNARVQAEDHVYIVGDFAFRNTNPAQWYLEQLAGHKHLIIGNHDIKTLKNETAMQCFESVEQMAIIKDGDQQVVLCHYPIAEWYGAHRGTVLVYGHIHGSTNDAYHFMKTHTAALNAAACINGYTPATLAELAINNAHFQKRVAAQNLSNE